jgi:putative membrane protein
LQQACAHGTNFDNHKYRQTHLEDSIVIIKTRIFTFLAMVGVMVQPAFAQAMKQMTPETVFVQKAAQGGIAEVELSKLAATNGASDSVKQFAAQMVQAHTDNNAKLSKIAQSEGIAVPTETDADHIALRNQLSAAKGADFDRIYVQAMRRDHTDMLHLLESADSLTDPTLKTFVAQTKPVVAHHLKMANELSGA